MACKWVNLFLKKTVFNEVMYRIQRCTEGDAEVLESILRSLEIDFENNANN